MIFQISVVILTQDEEKNLPDCLTSLRDLDCEIFVVDSGSTDNTCEIAREFGAQVVKHPFNTYSDQRNWALEHLPLHHEWVLHLDADERLTKELAREIQNRLKMLASSVDGFMMSRRTIFMGQWIRHGGHYPTYHLRLFRKNKGRCEDRLYDQHFTVEGKTEKLNNDFIDIVSSDLETFISRHQTWARLEAKEYIRENQAHHKVTADLFGNPIQKRRWFREELYERFPLYIRAFGYWLYRYILRLGFLDGKQGFLFHFIQGLWFRILTDYYIDKLKHDC